MGGCAGYVPDKVMRHAATGLAVGEGAARSTIDTGRNTRDGACAAAIAPGRAALAGVRRLGPATTSTAMAAAAAIDGQGRAQRGTAAGRSPDRAGSRELPGRASALCWAGMVIARVHSTVRWATRSPIRTPHACVMLARVPARIRTAVDGVNPRSNGSWPRPGRGQPRPRALRGAGSARATGGRGSCLLLPAVRRQSSRPIRRWYAPGPSRAAGRRPFAWSGSPSRPRP